MSFPYRVALEGVGSQILCYENRGVTHMLLFSFVKCWRYVNYNQSGMHQPPQVLFHYQTKGSQALGKTVFEHNFCMHSFPKDYFLVGIHDFHCLV